MATNSDGNIIERESLKLSLTDRYLNQRVGGAYHIQKELDVQNLRGVNETSIGVCAADVNFTINKGFKIEQRFTELKDAESGINSKQLSRYIQGFNNKKYVIRGFPR